MRISPTVKASRGEIIRLGGEIDRCEQGGKHCRIFWRTPTGRKVMTVCSSSTSDWRAAKKAVCLIRRQVRDLG